jgi:PilZ domain-containing protein
MTNMKERRGAARVVVPGRVGSRVRATLEAHLLDLSITGARIEHHNLLRPGIACVIELPATLGSLSLSVRIVRSIVIGTEEGHAGERLLRYESGLAFVGITGEQQATLARVLERLAPEGSLGKGKLVL